MKDIVTVGIAAAREAGQLLMDNFGKEDLKIEKKIDRSLATNIDKASEKLIIQRIRQNFHGHGIIGEEGGQEGAEDGLIWIIDPLDGTHNYIRGIPIFGVSIGVANTAGFVAGIIYLPVENTIYVAEKGSGAYRNEERIRVSAIRELSESTISFDSSLRNKSQDKIPLLGAVASNIFNLRMFGASVRVLTYLAEGRVDATLELDDRCWDYAAGACLIEEAGGKVSDLHGNHLTYRANGYIATNGLVHDEIVRMVQAHHNK